MNLEDLRDVRRRERRQDSLQPLRESFYRDVADYVAELKTERDRAAERADDPFADPEVRQLTDEIETAEEVVESIYERRVGKVVKHASFAAADMAHDDEGLTDEERDLFDDLVARVRENRERVLDTLAAGGASTAAEGSPAEAEAGDEPAGSTAETTPLDGDDATAPGAASDEPSDAPASTADAASAPDPNDLLAAAMGDGADAPTSSSGSDVEGGPAVTDATADSAGQPTAESGDSPGSADGTDSTGGMGSKADASGSAADRTTVRITEDVGEIYGVDDRNYDLAREDVVQLPADNARPLVEKNAAERL